MIIPPKLIYRLIEISAKIPTGFLFVWKLKFMWKCKGSILAQKKLEKEKVGGHTLPYVKNYYKATAIKRVG